MMEQGATIMKQTLDRLADEKQKALLHEHFGSKADIPRIQRNVRY